MDYYDCIIKLMKWDIEERMVSRRVGEHMDINSVGLEHLIMNLFMIEEM